ncbi:MAG TPA: MFS transporter [Microlunatus sp.]|nr:MFS transporter [Microlunatus sp.]
MSLDAPRLAPNPDSTNPDSTSPDSTSPDSTRHDPTHPTEPTGATDPARPNNQTEFSAAASSGVAPHSRLPRMFAALSVPNYRIWMAGAFVSNIGTWMQRVAQDWFVLELTHGSGVAVGITTALQFLPMLLLSPVGGLVADRFAKRSVLKVTQLWLAACAALLGVLAVTGVAQTWQVYVCAFLFGVGTAFDNPARQSFVSEVVGGPLLPNAIALNSATFHGARIIGPAVAGLVIAAFGSGWAILSNSVTYAAFIVALICMNPALLQPPPLIRKAKRQIRQAVSYVRGRPDVLLVLLVAFSVGTFGMNFQLTSALMAQQEFHRGPEQYGILGTFMAVGSLAGALIAARRTSAPSGRYVVVVAMIFGALEIASGLMPTYWAFAASLPALGLATLLTLTASNASVQMGVDPALRGRVMALYAMVLMGGTPVGAPVIGWIGQTFGPRWTLLGGGALTLVGVSLAALWLLPRVTTPPAAPVPASVQEARA